MTTTVALAQTSVTANGVTALGFTFQALSATEIEVLRGGVIADPSTYAVVLNPDSTGTITPTSTWSTDAVIIRSAPTYLQSANFPRFVPFFPDQLNPVLDRFSRYALALKAYVDRTAVSTPGTPGANASNPSITYVINTLAPGASATFASTGTYPNLTWTFGIPQGAAGAATGVDAEGAQDAVAAMIAAGTHTGISIAYNDPANSMSFTVSGATYTDENAQDAVAAMLAAGAHTGISVTYNDPANSMSLAYTGVTYTDEMAQDTIAAMLAAGAHTGITVTYNDAGNAMSLALSAATTSTRMISIPATAMIPRTTNGPSTTTTESTTNKVMIQSLDFDASVSKGAQFQFLMPKSWNEGTVTAEFAWTAGSGTGDVVWGIRAVAMSDGDAIDTAFGTAVTITDTLLAANQVHRSGTTSAMTVGATPVPNDLVTFEVYRDAAVAGDTLAVDARLIAVKLTIITDARDDS